MKLCDEVYFIWGSNHEILNMATGTSLRNSSSESNQAKRGVGVVRRYRSEKVPELQTKPFSYHPCSGRGVRNTRLCSWGRQVEQPLFNWGVVKPCPETASLERAACTSWDDINNYPLPTAHSALPYSMVPKVTSRISIGRVIVSSSFLM